ncbi:LPS assembly protein LptD [Thaumasiovibrio sp. DFM-14]|uniref:LPS assembly protein LptD n=1 Tax=Thaumasiovibrio sp. DFM-14 TaxID=3384792 RepID=UPI0039A1CDF7
MSLTSRSIIATAVSLALYGQPLQAKECLQHSDIDQTMINLCQQRPASPEALNQLPVTIEADYAEAQQDDKASYQGNVVVTQGNRRMEADRAVLRQPENVVTATGNVKLQDEQYLIIADKMHASLDEDTATLFDADYELICELGRGSARVVDKQNDTEINLKDATYTTCPINDDAWRFEAHSVDYDSTSPYVDLYGAKFAVKGVPILYMPYLRLPATDERLTGFLYPNASYGSRNGIELEVPFYWNIAPNYDLTLTPHYMQNRGVMLNSQFRYLNDTGRGALKTEYLGEDKEAPEDGALWAVNWRHGATFATHWRVAVDYSQVSQFNYFSKGLGSDIGNREDSSLLQTGSVAYRDTNWNATLSVRDFQSLTAAGSNSIYRLMPQLSMNYYHELPFGVEGSLLGQYSRFENDDDQKPVADRLHLEPRLYLPYAGTWWNLESEAKLMHTYYQQDFDINDNSDFVGMEESVSRTIPSLRLLSGITLERDTTVWGQAYLQTLEPKMQYLYIQDVDQSAIYNPTNSGQTGYDSNLLQQDYYGLFRDRQYSSIDYIAPANQFTVGASTRFFDEQYKERFAFSYGQIFYLDRPESGTDTKVNYSASAFETEFNYNDRTFFTAGLQYDASEAEIQYGHTTLEYRIGGNYIQTNYRYVSQSYLEQSLPNNDIDRSTSDGISQAGFSTGLRLNDNWYARGDIFYDTSEAILSESQFSLSYESCCWAISVGYNEYLKYRRNIGDTPEYENNISFNFRLLGLGGSTGFGSSSGGGNALSYRRPFYLNN